MTFSVSVLSVFDGASAPRSALGSYQRSQLLALDMGFGDRVGEGRAALGAVAPHVSALSPQLPGESGLGFSTLGLL